LIRFCVIPTQNRLLMKWCCSREYRDLLSWFALGTSHVACDIDDISDPVGISSVIKQSLRSQFRPIVCMRIYLL
jgi:hypothetical protein